MKIRLYTTLFIIFLLFGCTGKNSKQIFVTTVYPIASILQEIAGDKAEIVNLLPPGESPHTFSPGPSALKKISDASCLFYVSPLLDEWSTNLPCKNKIEITNLIPAGIKDFDRTDPHFWTDPVLVAAIAKPVAEYLGRLDPSNAVYYLQNADKFILKLQKLSANLDRMLTPVKNQGVILFHPSFRYMLRRYGLNYLGSVEPSPGKEPTPNSIATLLNLIKTYHVKALFSETELPEAPAEALAETSGLNIFKLDPLGGVDGRRTYDEIMLYNAGIIREALK